MAKYLQDIYITEPKTPLGFSKTEEESFYKENKHLWTSLKLIEDLYNFNFPKKYSTTDNLWRLFIEMTIDPNLDLSKKGFDNWFYLDIQELKRLDLTGRKKLLFEKVSKLIILFCKKTGYSYKEFELLNKLIEDKNILFDEPHKKDKTSPDRKHIAFIWRKYDEFENATYIKVENKTGQVDLFLKIGDVHFSNFDSLSWQDNATIHLFKINEFNGFKQADDFYEIKLNGSIEFIPQTKEANYYFGLELMRNIQTFDRGLQYIKIADKMNHGKAKNILLNLKMNPGEKNVDLLMQQSRKSKSKIV